MKWKLREKVLLLSSLAALLPFVTTNIFWYANAQNTIHKNAEGTIVLATSQATDKINDFLNTKLLGFLSHSQGAALLNGDTETIREDLLNMLLQDPDVETISFVDMSGLERIKVDRNHVYADNELVDVLNTPEFKVASFKFGKEYISQVTYSPSPIVRISVPVAYPKNSRSLRTFSSNNNEGRGSSEVRGVLVSTVSLALLADNINSLKIGNQGYVYVVDNEGKFITYKNKSFIGTTALNPNSEVQRFIETTQAQSGVDPAKPGSYTSLEGQPVLSSHKIIERTKWAVITEVPLSNISSDITKIQQQALLLALLPTVILITLSLYFAHRLINPIRMLVEGTKSISKGDFDFSFEQINTGDEIEQLGLAYTNMAQKIKEDQHALNAEKTALATVLGSIVDGVVALDKDYNVVFINHAASGIFDIDESRSIRKTLDSVINFKENDESVLISDLCKNLHDPTVLHKLSFLVTPTETKTVNLILSSVPPSQVTSVCYILTFYDVSKEAELENMKLDFVSMAAHELRTPLTAIKGYLSYLQEELEQKLTKDENTYLTRVIISSDQLSSLIENLLNVTKIERGILKLEIAPFSIEKLITDALTNLTEVASQRDINIEFENPEAGIPKVLGDQFRINQVLVNLVGNAINYTQLGGHIVINVESTQSDITVHIRDNGQGIPKAALPHLFTKFYRVGGALEQGSKGTGLGLFITKSIIDRHNGKIKVESEVGIGSTFSFTLPAAISSLHQSATG
ncbi:MAG: ATP-binding protein [bacterium]|nr:ATP-binding protein [bacterium]